MKIPPPHQILENKPHKNKARIVDAHRGRDERRRVQEHRRVDVPQPRVRLVAFIKPEWDGEKCADDYGVQLGVVQRAAAELARGSDEAPAT